MSLRDQFLKSGLITKKQAIKVDAEKKRHDHMVKKDHDLSQQVSAQKQKEALEIQKAFEKQQQIDRELNKKRDEFIAKREQMFRVMQIINSQAKNLRSSEELYYFAEEKSIRRVLVSSWQRELLARGALGIAKPNEQVDDYVLLPRESAKIVLSICPEKIIVLHSEIDHSEELTNIEKDTSHEFTS